MATYNTIPESADQLQKPKTSMKQFVAGAAAAAFFLGVIAATAVTTAQGSHAKYQLDVQDGMCPDGHPKMTSPAKFEVELGPCLYMDCGASLEHVYVELQDASDHAKLASG
jgi:hypothetical protein